MHAGSMRGHGGHHGHGGGHGLGPGPGPRPGFGFGCGGLFGPPVIRPPPLNVTVVTSDPYYPVQRTYSTGYVVTSPAPVAVYPVAPAPPVAVATAPGPPPPYVASGSIIDHRIVVLYGLEPCLAATSL